MDQGGILQRMRTAGLLLALFALVFKAMLPPGYMLSTDANQSIVMTLCGGGEAVLDLAGSSDQKPDHGSAGVECPFAIMSAPALAAPELAPTAPVLAHAIPADTPVHAFAAFKTPAGPPLPARGPPLYA